MATARYMTTEECAAWYWTVNPRDEGEYLASLLLRWRVDPVMFAVEGLRIILQPYQAQILLDLTDAPADLYDFYGLDPSFPKLQVLAPSGHGLGKTRTMAVAIWQTHITRPFSKRLVTAPTAEQITGQLFGEVRKMKRRLSKNWPMIANEWDVLTDAIRHKNPDYADWSTIARTARPDKPESLQGAHALDVDDEFGQLASLFDEEIEDHPSGGMLILIDEGSGVEDVVRETVEGALSEKGAMLFAAGNPTRPTGWFARDIERRDRFAVHELDCRMSDRTKVATLPYRDFGGQVHQLQIRGFVDPKYWEDILADCGGDEDHDRFRKRVRGKVPRSASEQIISEAWVDQAMARHPHAGSYAEPVVISLDFGLTGDKHGIIARQGFNVRDGKEWLKKDRPQEITLEAADRAIAWQELYKAKYIIGDANGVGRGAMEYLARYYRERPELGVTVNFFNAGAAAIDRKRYRRRRDEMWFRYGRPWVSDHRTYLPNLPGLKRQLCEPQYDDSNNVVIVETKDQVEHRTGDPSGNLADALLQSLCVHMAVEDTTTEQKQPEHPEVFEKHFTRWRARQQGESGVYIR